jgi:pyrroloquinoline quinone biosynthesis protein B
MRILVLGSGAVAVSADGGRWVLLNASPDLGAQRRELPALHARGTPIKAVVLTDAQIDHVAGLLSLREGPPVELYCTPCVFEDLTGGLPLLPALQHYCGVHWHLVPVAGEERAADFRIEAVPGLRLRALALDGDAPPYSPHRHDPAVGDSIALVVEDVAGGESLFYAPGLARLGEAEHAAMSGASCVLVDGTFWTDDVMSDAGLGPLARLPVPRKLLVHVDHGHPILDEDSAERRALRRHGVEVAHDGMEIDL